ncbi:acyl-[acyl-carrier-protein] desaturase 4, chloroplastic-like [Phragmites australis]|uniref:acyl-[acyl-carrier-protein] desaturase 4, chloroplastic-like n=1 Tax=Phragmites australis TaxID=29695 RepID=UPI002D7672FD|nr:acyl-[acyl-carrier-protein] desaturase 4, chloroplastic-like [Phragmites australis]
MPAGLMTMMMPLPSSPLSSVNLCRFCCSSKKTTTTTTMPLVNNRSSTLAAHLLGRTASDHSRTARRAALHGDACLAKVCGVIAADEKRHEAAYTRTAARTFETDPDGMVRALAAVMRAKITMPGERMTDGRDEQLFDHFSSVAQRAGVYTAADYGDMVEHFVRRWRVAELGGEGFSLSSEGRRAQDYVCGLPRKIRRIEELAHDRAALKEPESASFSWVFERPVRLR